MTFEIVPGNALGCRTNAHRHGWDGSICDDAAEWACGIEADFRSKYCQNEIPRCFHLHLFDEEDPHLVIPDSGVGWVLGRTPTAFDDQILLIWAPQAEEPRGLVSGRPAGSFMAGAYRIGNVERVEQRNHVEWKIRPHDDGWAYLGGLDLQAPRFIHLGGPYIKQVEANAVVTLFETGREAGAELNEVWTEAERDRLENFCNNLAEWQKIAEERASKLMGIPKRPMPKTRGQKGEGAKAGGGPGRKADEDGPELRQRTIPTPPKVQRPDPPDTFPLIEESKREAIRLAHGEETLAALSAAEKTRPLLILRGLPGVGKSHLALELIDDPNRQRTLIVPVSPLWRGREDLLGRTNRARQQFEPTGFTNFMRAAHLAWLEGDYSTRLVVFEHFDLAPPEAWLSEILLRASYPLEPNRDRTIHFEAESVRGWEGPSRTRLFLPPTVHFVATVDEPVRAEAFSPRLLDAAAVVRVSMTPARALELAEVKLEKAQLEVIETLDEALRDLAISFSLTEAHGLGSLLGEEEKLELEGWKAIDLILGQGILAKLEMLETDSVEERAHLALSEWCQSNEDELPGSAGGIRKWLEKGGRLGVTS